MAGKTFWFRDPFAGDESAPGNSIEDAIEGAYAHIAPEERPAYVTYRGRQIAVPGGTCVPLQ